MSLSWRGTIPIFINNFNWLTPARGLAEYFDDIPGAEVVIVDNASTYPALLDWYATCHRRIVRLEENLGHRAPWHCGAVQYPAVHRAFWGSEYYAVTDPDLSLSGCPKDLLDLLILGHNSYPGVNKVGLSLEIGDLPDQSPSASFVREWESQFWIDRLNAQFIRAAVDTTFALYSIVVPFEKAQSSDGNSIRTDHPYTAKHLPWYFTLDALSDEEEYYLKNTRHGHWGRYLQGLLQHRQNYESVDPSQR